MIVTVLLVCPDRPPDVSVCLFGCLSMFFWEPTESTPFREPTESAPFQEPTESAPFREPTDFAPIREPTESTQETSPLKWWLSAPYRWRPTLLAPPWPPALPIPPGPLLLHGPGPPSLPQICLRPTPLDIFLFLCVERL